MTRTFPLEDPLQATAAEYQRAADDYNALAAAAAEIATALTADPADSSFSGEAATAVTTLMAEHVDRIHDVDALGSSIGEVFGTHAAGQEELEVQVKEVLARARINWDQLLVAQDALEAAEADRQQASRQVQSMTLSVAADPSQVIAANDELELADRRLRTAQTTADDATDTFNADRTALEELAQRERELDGVTVGALGQQDLHDLADPGFFDKLGGVFGGGGSALLGVFSPIGGPALWPLVPPIASALDEGGDRFVEYGRYLVEANGRRVERDGFFALANPFDPLARLDAVFEDGAAAVGILGMGGELYHGDTNVDSDGDGVADAGFCGDNHSCIVGVATPLGGAITLGHTVLYTNETPSDAIVAHEQQHVFQYEEHGTVGFLTRWLASGAVDVALGGDGYLDTDHEREGYYVQDFHGHPGAAPSPDLVVPHDYFPSDNRDYNFGWWTDRPDAAKRLSAQITEWIWQ